MDNFSYPGEEYAYIMTNIMHVIQSTLSLVLNERF